MTLIGALPCPAGLGDGNAIDDPGHRIAGSADLGLERAVRVGSIRGTQTFVARHHRHRRLVLLGQPIIAGREHIAWMVFARRDPLGLRRTFDLDGGMAKALAVGRRSVPIGAHIVAIVDDPAFPANARCNLVVERGARGIRATIGRQEAQPARIIGVDCPRLGTNIEGDVAGSRLRRDLAAGVAARLVISRAAGRGRQGHAGAFGSSHRLAGEIGRWVILHRSRAGRRREDLGIAEGRSGAIGVGGDAILLVRRLGRLGRRFQPLRIVEIGALRQVRARIARHGGRLCIVRRHQRGVVPLLGAERLALLPCLIECHLPQCRRSHRQRHEQHRRGKSAPHGAVLRMLERPTAAIRAPGPLPSANCSSAYSTETLPTSRS
jgi:hypothetical protein